ncbi:MAG: metallophosphoesterase [Peptostreptococcaceae bacterium]|jgi:predicted phosphohydrolase|nr:metallophosphoesterase [Peptostreptococcaceae bacterium]
MSLFAIGDLHMSNKNKKPMDIFGENWINHKEKIFQDWKKKVCINDTVLIVGDTSWAMNMEEAKYDLDEINELPGKKIIIKGNHDYWWTSIKKLNSMYDDMNFIQNNYFIYQDYAICGSRGWICPNNNKFDDKDEKIYLREIIRIENSIKEAKKQGFEKFIIMTHYPPTNDNFDESKFIKLYKDYDVKKVIYGHLHGKESFSGGIKGNLDDIEYHLVSCDYLDFKLKQIL